MWPLLEGVPDAELREILQVARRRSFAKNEVVCHRWRSGRLDAPDLTGDLRRVDRPLHRSRRSAAIAAQSLYPYGLSDAQRLLSA